MNLPNISHNPFSTPFFLSLSLFISFFNYNVYLEPLKNRLTCKLFLEIKKKRQINIFMKNPIKAYHIPFRSISESKTKQLKQFKIIKFLFPRFSIRIPFCFSAQTKRPLKIYRVVLFLTFSFVYSFLVITNYS